MCIWSVWWWGDGEGQVPFFGPYDDHMDLCNEPCLSVWPAILHGKNLMLDTTHRLFDHVFIPAILIGATVFCHFIPLLQIMTLPGGHMVSAKQNLFGFIFSHTFHLITMKFHVVMKQFKLNNLRLLESDLYFKKRQGE